MFRGPKPLLIGAVLAAAGLAVGGAPLYPSTAPVPHTQLPQRAQAPRPAVRPTPKTNGSRIIQAALDATIRGGTLTLRRHAVYIVATPLVVPPDITVDGNGALLETPADSTTPQSNDAIMQASSGDTVRNFVFDGNVHNQNGVWTEHRHEISIGFATDVTIEDNTFQNIIADGIYSNGASFVRIDRNQFIGDHSNRDGVSVISGSHVRIYDNTFWSMSRPDMPAAVDLEPNLSSQGLDDIYVYDNTVNDPVRRGLMEWDSVGAASNNVRFSDNVINGGPAIMSNGIGILVSHGTATVSDNYINNCLPCDGIEYYNATGGEAFGNHLDGVQFGITRFRSPTVSVSGNTYVDVSGSNERNYS